MLRVELRDKANNVLSRVTTPDHELAMAIAQDAVRRFSNRFPDIVVVYTRTPDEEEDE